MRDLDAVLVANSEFYRAFAERDVDGMAEIWARRGPVSCIHPGWPPIIGREEVMASWRQILGGRGAPAIECLSPEALSCGDAIFVLCFERVDDAMLAATNIFARENGVWKLVHHQAGPTDVESGDTDDRPVGTIH